jgi:hypothetical protein
MQRGGQFKTLKAIEEAINQNILDNRESFRVKISAKSNTMLFAKRMAVGLLFVQLYRVRMRLRLLESSPTFAVLLSTTTIEGRT